MALNCCRPFGGRGPLGRFYWALKTFRGPPRGSCGFYRMDTQLVWDFIGTRMRFLEQEIHASSYGVKHGVRV
jgi:hypothetical protein